MVQKISKNAWAQLNQHNPPNNCHRCAFKNHPSGGFLIYAYPKSQNRIWAIILKITHWLYIIKIIIDKYNYIHYDVPIKKILQGI